MAAPTVWFPWKTWSRKLSATSRTSTTRTRRPCWLLPWAKASGSPIPRLPLEDLDVVLGTNLTDGEISEDVDTLGGLLYVSIGRVPVRGELLLVPEEVPGLRVRGHGRGSPAHQAA